MELRPSVNEVVEKVSKAAFGNPLVTNVLRGQLVEAIIAIALEPEWTWCASDYSSWDFERADGLRLEVKQSSARQTWDPPAPGKIRTSFDIRSRIGRWEGPVFVEEPGRAAHFYVFAYHGVIDDTADHRDASQWQFYVVQTKDLPSTQRISLSALEKIAVAVTFIRLADAVLAVATKHCA